MAHNVVLCWCQCPLFVRRPINSSKQTAPCHPLVYPLLYLSRQLCTWDHGQKRRSTFLSHSWPAKTHSAFHSSTKKNWFVSVGMIIFLPILQINTRVIVCYALTILPHSFARPSAVWLPKKKKKKNSRRGAKQLCEQARASECPLWFTSTAVRKLHPSLPLNTAVVLPVHLDSDSDDEDRAGDDYIAVRGTSL